MLPLRWFLVALLTWLAADLRAAEPTAPEPSEPAQSAASDAPPAVNFSRDVLPLLSENCFHCHGPDPAARQASLRLDTEAGSRAAGDSGEPAIVPGQRGTSELWRRIASHDADEQMPPAKSNRKLTPVQIELIGRWLDGGAAWGKHWAFEGPYRPEPPAVKQAAWPRNEIDRFVLATLEANKLKPSPEASRETLLRRVTLDLTGLPPTVEELDAFLADNAPDAYERAVDRLLASPRYGERWCWDWLDAARYADTNGYQGDPERTMWPWRDWVIDAINKNMPYDQFTVEQLAGDLLPNATKEQTLATGFNRNHMHNGEGGRIPEESRVENVFDRVETTGTIWLGVTIGCTRCHDHKYDPFTQREYYQFYDYFNQTSEDGRGRSGQATPALDMTSKEQTERLAELRKVVRERAAEVAALEPAIYVRPEGEPASHSERGAKMRELFRTDLDKPVGSRGNAHWTEAIEEFEQTNPDYVAAIRKLLKAGDQQRALDRTLPRVMVMDTVKEPRESFILVKGAYNKPADKVTAGVPASLPPLPADAPKNRLALAQWLVAKENPLTARVTVNRFWQALFGIGLVKTADDFGVQGERPKQQALLDWLATEFMHNGWDVKRLHRQIVTSATYRQSSRVSPALVEVDPENRLMARGARYRLPSWMLRDQALAQSGLLVDRRGGPPVKPYQPPGIWEEATFGKTTYTPDTGEKLYRRTLYTFWRRIVGPTMLFDNSARQVCSVKQVRTNTPLHALVTLNETVYVEASRALAERVLEAGSADNSERLERLFRRVVARRPTAAEQDILLKRLAILQQHYDRDRDAAKALLSVGDSKRNEKLDLAEHAAWAELCSLVMNLDEAVTRE
ncbi:MAG: DUF1549 domain-containing protein [Planctomycetes bacterium]|nr:DUF1549 domain-containing protein [Planctomycetota bacterium]